MTRLVTLIFMILGLVGSGSILAHSAADSDNEQLQALVKQSDVIFYGEVKEVLYRMSDTTKRAPNGIPHTFVRYQIFNTFRGSVSREIILRFVGGTDGKGGIMMQSNVPTFRKGNQQMVTTLHNHQL